MKNYVIICFLLAASTVFSQNYFYALDEEPKAPDTEAPSAPLDLVVNNVAYTTVDLSWSLATDNVAVTNYKILIYDSNDVLVKTNTITNYNNYTEIDLQPDTPYFVSVRALDAAFNESEDSNKVAFTTKSHGPNMLSEQLYFDAVLLPLSKKDSLQAYIDLYDHVRLEKGDYGRISGTPINLSTNQSIYGFPTETNTPEINVLPGSSYVVIDNINPFKVNLLEGAPIRNILISCMSNSTIRSTGGQLEDNLFLNIARSGIQLDFSASGYYRNNRVYRHMTQGGFLELSGNSSTPSYGNLHVWNNFLTPNGDAAYINAIQDISFIGFDSEGWNLRNQTTRNAMFKAENIGNIKITDFGGGNDYCAGCEQPAWDIQADNLFIFNKKITDNSVEKSIARTDTNVFVLEENHQRDPYRKESGVYDVKLSTEYGLGIYDDHSIYINDNLVSTTITDPTTIDKIKANILQPKLKPIDRPVHETLPDPLGPNWATERVGKPDSRAYIQNLIDTDTIAQLPEGVFYISGTLNINGDDAFKGGIIGAGTGKTVICGLTDDFPLITVNKFEQNQQSRINLAHLTLQGGSTGLFFPTYMGLTALNNWRYVIFRNQNIGIHLEQIFGMDNCFFNHLSFVNCGIGIYNDPKNINDPDFNMMQDAGYIDKVVFYKNQFINCNTAMQIKSFRGSNLNAWIECNFNSNGLVGTMGGQNFAKFVNCDFTNNRGNATDKALFNGNGVSLYNCDFSGNTSQYTFNTTGLLAEGCSFLDSNQLMSSEVHFNQSQYIVNSIITATSLGGGWGNNQGQYINSSFTNIPALNKLMVTMKDNVITTIIDEAPNPYPQFLVKH
ncbi:fibronectin type III domain-containing protein [Litoribaculum gwangyangense]|uniref:Fibronectin type-III domain-containing protein n=1 Tax=Litoribaculum gwangyangense TaxID=1130722 RepID=A0ABP9CS39_9FLAO